jgi:hypothetical protein
MRLLVSFEEEYRVYRDAIARAILVLRPHVEVSLVESWALREEVAGIRPHLVISDGRPSAASARGVPAWLRVPTWGRRSAELWRGEERSELGEAGLDALLGIVDETERVARAKGGRSIRAELDDALPAA